MKTLLLILTLLISACTIKDPTPEIAIEPLALSVPPSIEEIQAHDQTLLYFASHELEQLRLELEQLRLELAYEQRRIPYNCGENALLQGTGNYSDGSYQAYKCGPVLNDYTLTEILTPTPTNTEIPIITKIVKPTDEPDSNPTPKPPKPTNPPPQPTEDIGHWGEWSEWSEMGWGCSGYSFKNTDDHQEECSNSRVYERDREWIP